MKLLPKITLTLLTTIILVLGFALPVNPPVGNWYQQFMPFLNNRPLRDITFLDSLNGYAITGDETVGDTNYILKTTNRGDNWSIVYTVYRDLTRVMFLNANVGFVCGGFNAVGGYLIKTTNGGINWNVVPNSNFANHFEDMSIFGQDTIFLADDNGLNGGIYRTTNGGANWTAIFMGAPGIGPYRIYMINNRIGFFSEGITTALFKTTNGGFNWSQIPGMDGFRDMEFVDSLLGWKAGRDSMKATTNGGINWVRQTLPYSGILLSTVMTRFTALNKDTLWGCGGFVLYPNTQFRGILYRTTNGGINWSMQIPDTSKINIGSYFSVQFTNKRNGWAYANYPTIVTGIHTTNGGDTTFLLGIHQISSEIPKQYFLYQNYPNPFNPKTNIKYQITKSEHVNLIIYDITGRRIIDLVNQKQSPGTYEVDFSGSGYSSGVYFYSLIADGVVMHTKKMVLIK